MPRSGALWVSVIAFAVGAAACGSPRQNAPVPASAPAANPISGGSQPSGPRVIKISFIGDSITAGFGLLSDQAYPAAIGQLFAADGYHEVEILNAGVTGDTTAAALRRLDDAIDSDVRILVVALGGNDALRGLSPRETHDNLAAIIEQTAAKGVGVVLVGMMAPPNLGPDYREAFSKAFIDLSREYKEKVVYIPFLLEGVAGNPALNQPDGIHPTAEGAKIIADHLYPTLRNLVDALQ